MGCARAGSLLRLRWPAMAELAENLFIVLTERRWRRIDPRTAMGEGERGKRHAETTFDSVGGRVAVNDAAGRELRVGHRFSHCAHARGRHVVRLQERLPFIRC